MENTLRITINGAPYRVGIQTMPPPPPPIHRYRSYREPVGFDRKGEPIYSYIVPTLRYSYDCVPLDSEATLACAPSPAAAVPARSTGEIRLHTVPAPIAAQVMALTAYELRRPLAELHFVSIKEVPSE